MSSQYSALPHLTLPKNFCEIIRTGKKSVGAGKYIGLGEKLQELIIIYSMYVCVCVCVCVRGFLS